MKQSMNLLAPPRGALPEWGTRVDLGNFFVELVAAGPRKINVRLDKCFASISYGPDEGQSSLAGDRLRKFERRPYEFVVVPPNFPLRGESLSAPEVLVYVFDFEGIRLDVAAALQVSPDILEPRVVIDGPRPLTTEMARRIRRHMLRGDISDEYLKALCIVMLVEMMRLPRTHRETGRGERLDESTLETILTYIDANLDSELTVEILARICGVVTHQFARSFKTLVGDPPHKFILNRRVETARQLLESTSTPIADIAYATGFSSQSHLTTTLRRQLGITPGQLRSAQSVSKLR